MCIGFRARKTPRMASPSSEVKWARFWPCWRRADFSLVFCGHLRGWPLGSEVAFSLSRFGAFRDPEILYWWFLFQKNGDWCLRRPLIHFLSPFDPFPSLLNTGCSQHASSSWQLVVTPSYLDELHFNQLHLTRISEVPVCTISSTAIIRQSVITQP